MKSRSFFAILSGVVLGLVLLGAIGAYWLTASAPAQLPKQNASHATPTAAMFVPRQSAVMVSLLVNPDRLESFWLAEAAAPQRKSLKADLGRLQQSLFSTVGLDYERDLKAWLGDEVTFALTSPDIDRDPANGSQPGYLLALAVEDPQVSQTAVQAFWRRTAAKDLVTESFAGVPIVHAADADSLEEPEVTFASAMVGNQYVLFANSPKVIRSALNSVQVASLSLESSFTYQQALEQLSGQQFGVVFAAVAQMQPWLSQPFLRSNLLSKTPLLSLFDLAAAAQRYDSLMVTLKPDPQGILADAAGLLSEPGLQPSSKAVITDASPLLKFIPSGSTLAIASKDLRQTWQYISDQLQEGWLSNLPLATRVESTLASLQQQWGINFAEDVFDWVTGEYAVAQIPRADQPQPDWIFVTQRSPEAEAGLDRLDQIAQQQGASIGTFSLSDQKIYAWTKLVTRSSSSSEPAALQAEVQGVHTTVGAYELVTTSLEAMQEALETAQADTQPDFQAAVARLQTPNQGYVYLDRKMLAGLQAEFGLESLKPLLNSTQSAVLSSYGVNETGRRGAVFLHLEGL
ncbi:MAG: DUF3352 domain-containing protein [Cyanobacteria bacterium RM1_2_2]|nr:DUF3352 domain-containing protein [Cyanobacteria bacterium RM1_2_2]